MSMREEFNNWYDNERKKSEPFSTVNIRDKCFEAWQASRAALVVELPREHGTYYPSMFSDEVRNALSLAGITVKS